MQYLIDFSTNYYLVSAIGAWLIAQIIKIFTGIFKVQEFSLYAMFFGTGGMPSSHTAAVCSLATACGIGQGFGSVAFAIAGVLAMVVMIDAMGVRRETGRQSRALNFIFKELFSATSEEADMHFKELIGHSPLQVLFGAITGIATASLFQLIPVLVA